MLYIDDLGADFKQTISESSEGVTMKEVRHVSFILLIAVSIALLLTTVSLIAAENLHESMYEFGYALAEAVKEIFCQPSEGFYQLNEALEMLIEEIEEYATENAAEIEISHSTVYKSKINDWMIIFELLKVPIR